MTTWKTRMRLQTENKVLETEDIKIQCGLFQGDSLSPLLFCICLIPLPGHLNRLNTGYEDQTTKMKISHLLYMDDINLLPKEQKGCCRGTKGCKDHLLLSKAIVQDCKRKEKI